MLVGPTSVILFGPIIAAKASPKLLPLFLRKSRINGHGYAASEARNVLSEIKVQQVVHIQARGQK